jgi:hypothetical protein
VEEEPNDVNKVEMSVCRDESDEHRNIKISLHQQNIVIRNTES